MNFFNWLVLAIAVKVFSFDTVPILRPLTIIPSWQSLNIKKISWNSNLLIVLTDNGKVYNWNRTDYSRSEDVIQPVNNHFGSYISYQYFSFDSNDCISFNSLNRAAILAPSQTISFSLDFNIPFNYHST
jgi:hypothetical protein